MRHGKGFNHLGRTPSHRKAMLSNMATSLIIKKRISTTLAKAKELRKYVEPLLTRAKADTTHSRRMVFRYLQDKNSVEELFGDIAEKIASRPGGYTRILKTGTRLGDSADMCIIELVDYNELMKSTGPKESKGRRRRKKKSGADVAESSASEAKKEEVKSKTDKTGDPSTKNQKTTSVSSEPTVQTGGKQVADAKSKTTEEKVEKQKSESKAKPQDAENAPKGLVDKDKMPERNDENDNESKKKDSE